MVPTVAQQLRGLSAALTVYERSVTAGRGRAGLRRLNAYEYENALRDLLNIPWVQIKSKLPQDGEAWRYNKIGAALDVSHVQLARYMSSADYAVVTANGDLYWSPDAVHGSAYHLVNNAFSGGPVPGLHESWGQVKARYHSTPGMTVTPGADNR